MKIAWFTPLNRRSAIGHYSARIVDELVRTEQVVVYVSDTDQAEACWPVHAGLVFLSKIEPDSLPQVLSAYDCVIYNMGNHFGYHGAIYEASLRHPGIVIVHDLVLQHFFGYYFLEYRRDWDSYIRHMAYAHGPEGEQLAKLVRTGREWPVWNTPAAVQYHMAKPAIRRKYGVIVHSDYAKRKLEPTATAPVRKINFPEPAISKWFPRKPGPRKASVVAWSPDHPTTSDQATAGDPEKVHLLTFGMVNRNKLVDQVIETIGGNDYLRRNVVYTILGSMETPEYGQMIDNLIRKNDLGGSVRVLGPQPDEVLVESLQAADLVINLRYPYLGESSWSLLEALFAGKPTIVWRHGYYDEFPDTVVKKVASEEELLTALVDLCQSPEIRLAMGLEAWSYARMNFDTKQYCRQLLDFIDSARLNRPVLDLVDRMSERLLEMGAQTDSVDLIDTLEREICRLAAVGERGASAP